MKTNTRTKSVQKWSTWHALSAVSGHCLMLWCLMLWCPHDGAAQEPVPAKFAEHVSLPTDAGVVKQLATVADLLRDEQFADAITKLQEIQAAHPNTLVSVYPGRYVTVSTYVNLLLSTMPEAGRDVYRQRLDRQAEIWLKAGREQRNAAELQKVVQQAWLSSHTDEALFLLGELAWDAGDLATARQYWEQLIPLNIDVPPGTPAPVLRYPDSDIPPVDVLARMAVCTIVAGDRQRAEFEIATFDKLFPKAQGTLAGKTGLYRELLQDVALAAANWPSVENSAEISTYGGNVARNEIADELPDVAAPLWEVPLPENPWRMVAPRGFTERGPLLIQPLVHRETVYFADSERIYAINLRTGRAKWPTDESDGRIETVRDLRKAVIYTVQRTFRPSDELRGVPAYTLTAAGNRLYARMGQPITERGSQAFGELKSQLVILDLDQQGKLLETIDVEDVVPDALRKTAWFFEGSPLVVDGKLFVALRSSPPQVQAAVACLDAETGTLIWTKTVGSEVDRPDDRRHGVSHRLLTYGNNQVYFSTDFGAITALAADTGRTAWVVTYPVSPSWRKRWLKPDPQRAGVSACVFDNGVLFAAPADSDEVFAIVAHTGVIRWRATVPPQAAPIQQLAGVVDGALIAVGDAVCAFEQRSGDVRFLALAPPFNAGNQRGRLRSPPETRGSAVMSADTIWQPVFTGIVPISTQGPRAEARQAIDLQTRGGGSGGNLVVAGEMLLVAESRRLVAYGNIPRQRERLIEVIRREPQQAENWWRLAQLNELGQDPEQAFVAYRQGLANVDEAAVVDGQSMRRSIRADYFRLLGQQSANALKNHEVETAEKVAEEALQIAGDADEIYRAGSLLAAAAIKRVDPSAAVDAWQRTRRRLLELPTSPPHPTAVPPISWQAARLRRVHMTTLALRELRERHGRAIYRPWNERAATELADAADDPQTILEVCNRYPLAEVVPAAQGRAAQMLQERDETQAALALLESAIDEPVSPAGRRQLLEQTARIAENCGETITATQAWRQLLAEFPQDEIAIDEHAGDVRAVVARHLNATGLTAEFAQLATVEPRLPWSRDWSIADCTPASLIIPDGLPPREKSACVLVRKDGRLECRDERTGGLRWQLQTSQQHSRAWYTPAGLLIDDGTLHCHDLDNGGLLWSLGTGFLTSSHTDSTHSGNSCADVKLVGRLLLALQPHAVTAFHLRTGQLVWRHDFWKYADEPDAERLRSPCWFADGEHTVLQIPAVGWTVLETQTGTILQSRGGELHDTRRLQNPTFSLVAWSRPPVRIGPTAFALVDVDHRISLLEFPQQQVRTFRGPNSYANGSPRVIGGAGLCLAVIDADRLLRLHPESADTLWSQPIGFVSAGTEPQIATDGTHIWLATLQDLRCLSVSTGKQVWRQRRPGDGLNRLILRGRYLIQSGDEGGRVLVSLAATGQPVQQLEQPGAWQFSRTGRAYCQDTAGNLHVWSGTAWEPPTES